MAALTAVIASPFVIASEAKQSPARSRRRCAPRDDKYASRDDKYASRDDKYASRDDSASVIASEAKQSTQ